MTAIARNIWRDLIDRRLWPVALLLVILLIAIPVVLAKPAPKVTAPATPVASSSPAPLVATPAAIRSNTGNAPVGGIYKNPFKQQHLPKKPAQDTGVTSKSGSASSPSSDKKSSGGGSGGSGNDNSSSNSNRNSSKRDTVTALKVRFGLADGKRKVRKITPGTPLPAGTSPLIVFLDFHGSRGGKFLVSSDVVKTEGDGKCKPSAAVCSTLSIHDGDTRFFDTQDGRQYQLDVLGVVGD